MNGSQDDISRRIASGTRGAAAILAAQLCVFAFVGWYGHSQHGMTGVHAAAVACLVCFLPAAVALCCVALTAGTPNALTGTLLSMVLRTALPFFVTIFLVQAHKPLADAGLFGMVLINYLVVLTVESALAVRMIQTLAPTAVRQ